MNITKQGGFTLIEVLVALIIFAILATITASVMNQTLRTREHLTDNMNELNQWQFALTIIEKDTQNIVNRPIRMNNMQLRPACVAEPQHVEFTRGGLINPFQLQHRSTLQRIAYVCQKRTLIRRSWAILDPVNVNDYHDKILLHDLSQCSFAFLDQSNHIITSFSSTEDVPYPRAIQMILNKNSDNKSSFLWPLRL